MIGQNARADVAGILARLIERVEGRYFGKYRGQVVDNEDPDNLGRIKAKVPRVLGEETSGWALPAFAYGGTSEQGLFALPDKDAGVWIEFEGGDLSFPIWSGTWYSRNAVPEKARAGMKIWKTKSGHKIVLDDDAPALHIRDSKGSSITLDSGGVKITAGNGTKITIDATNIELVGGAGHPLVLGDKLLQYLQQLVSLYQSHQHIGQQVICALPGVTVPVLPSPPIPPVPPPTPDLLSLKVKTE